MCLVGLVLAVLFTAASPGSAQTDNGFSGTWKLNASRSEIRNLPVPAGFTMSTEVCAYYYANKKTYPKSLAAEVKGGLEKVESAMGAKFGDPKNPLLVSVRSGALCHLLSGIPWHKVGTWKSCHVRRLFLCGGGYWPVLTPSGLV